jgi:hypothetical protein
MNNTLGHPLVIKVMNLISNRKQEHTFSLAWWSSKRAGPCFCPATLSQISVLSTPIPVLVVNLPLDGSFLVAPICLSLSFSLNSCIFFPASAVARLNVSWAFSSMALIVEALTICNEHV